MTKSKQKRLLARKLSFFSRCRQDIEKKKAPAKKREKYELTLKDKRNKNIEKFQLRFWKIFEIITSTKNFKSA